MTDKTPVGWTVTADDPEKGFVGFGFETHAEAEAKARELREAGMVNVQVVRSELKPQ
jgi:hypothetical protein